VYSLHLLGVFLPLPWLFSHFPFSKIAYVFTFIGSIIFQLSISTRPYLINHLTSDSWQKTTSCVRLNGQYCRQYTMHQDDAPGFGLSLMRNSAEGPLY
ncbi:hypothetical protein PMAYCL1PPCAC_22346, partial [Pristionchus mayeri]